MIKKMVDNIFSITDKVRIKIVTTLLDSSDPWMNRKKDSVYYNRVIRWDIKIDCSNADSLKSISSVQLNGGDLLMLESMLSNVVLNKWFLEYEYEQDGSLSNPAQGDSRTLILTHGGIIKFKPIVLARTRAIQMKLSDEIECILDEFKVRELIYFLKKFDPYTYSAICASIMQNSTAEHLSNIKKNFFDKSQLNTTIPEAPKLRGKQIGDGMKNII